MSSLISDLNQIYEIKGQIKEVANIESDVFSEFPGYIAAAIASGGATGTIEIDANGTHNVATYEYAYVNVPQQEVPVVPPGYTYVYGSYNVTANGSNVDIASYAYINVNVPAPEGWLYPSGYAYITSNGDFNIREFEGVTVAVPQSGITPEGTSYITVNGVYDIGTYSYVDVNVPQGGITPTGYAYIIANGDYDITSYAMVNVNVPQSGGGDEYVWVDPASYTMVVGEKYAFNGKLGTSAQGQITSEIIAMYPALEPYLNWYIYSISGENNGSNWAKTSIIETPGDLPGHGVIAKGTWAEPVTGNPMFIVDELYAAKYAGGNGTLSITSNGTSSVDQYAYVSVNVSPSFNSYYNYINAASSGHGINYSYQLQRELALGPGYVGGIVNDGNGQYPYMNSDEIDSITSIILETISAMNEKQTVGEVRINIDDVTSTYLTSNMSVNNYSGDTITINFTNLWDYNPIVIDGAYIEHTAGQLTVENGKFINQQNYAIKETASSNNYLSINIQGVDFSSLTTAPINVDVDEYAGVEIYLTGCTFPDSTVAYIVNGSVHADGNCSVYVDYVLQESFPVVNPNVNGE